MKKRVAFYTLGCKLNFSETSSIGRQFEKAGFETVGFHDEADVYVVNTCSVTEHADKKCRKIVKEALKYSPTAFIVIVGCYAQLKPQEIIDIPGVDMVLGAAEKFNIVEHIQDLTKKDKASILNRPIADTNIFVPAFSYGDRTRTFLKVQDGCDYSCTFCTIPLARGKSRSGRIQEIVQQAKDIAESGVREIVLTGVNIGDFGIREGKREAKLLELIQELDRVEGIDRFRISSIEPNLLSNEIIQFVSTSKRFVPHFHMPLQSGSNTILRLMRRRYQKELYEERVQYIKSLMPNCCIGVDVIVGFPGESNEEFLASYDFLNRLPVSYLHVFTYSERENTIAAQMEGAVPGSQRSDRSKMLHILSDKKRMQFYESQLGSVVEVLFEADNKNGFMHGFSENYVRVATPFDPLLINEIKSVHLKELNGRGEVVPATLDEVIPY